MVTLETPSINDSPLELFDRDGDLQVVPEDVQGREDVGPLDHLSQRPAFQNLRAEDVARFLRQKTHVHQNLQRKNKQPWRLTFLIPQEPHLSTSRELKHASQRGSDSFKCPDASL